LTSLRAGDSAVWLRSSSCARPRRALGGSSCVLPGLLTASRVCSSADCLWPCVVPSSDNCTHVPYFSDDCPFNRPCDGEGVNRQVSLSTRVPFTATNAAKGTLVRATGHVCTVADARRTLRGWRGRRRLRHRGPCCRSGFPPPSAEGRTPGAAPKCCVTTGRLPGSSALTRYTNAGAAAQPRPACRCGGQGGIRPPGRGAGAGTGAECILGTFTA